MKLDENRDYSAKVELLRWEKNMKEDLEAKTFRMRGALSYEEYNKGEENII